MLPKETIKKLRIDPDWLAFAAHAKTCLQELDDLSEVKDDLPADEYKIECLSRKRAGEKLSKILEPFFFLQDDEDTEDREKTTRQAAGL